MRLEVECLPCFSRQIVSLSSRLAPSPAAAARWARESLRLLAAADWRRPPPELAAAIEARLRELSGNPDPFRAAKLRQNRFFLRHLPEFRSFLRRAPDRLEAALRLAIAGNVIDLGVAPELSGVSVRKALEEARRAVIPAALLRAFRRDLNAARRILYLADNCGEIVFDRLLIEELPRHKIALVVRGAPILNDATRREALEVGLGELVEIVENGTAVPGTSLRLAPPAFRRRMAAADLIISKGQGNYETLQSCPRTIYYLLKVKCAVVARKLRAPLGAAVFLRKARPARRRG